MDSSKNSKWIIPFKKFSMVRVKVPELQDLCKSISYNMNSSFHLGWDEFLTVLVLKTSVSSELLGELFKLVIGEGERGRYEAAFFGGILGEAFGEVTGEILGDKLRGEL